MLLTSLIAALFICFLSLSGAVFYLIRPQKLQTILPYFVALAVGVLLGNAFIHLIPDAVEEIGSIEEVLLFTLGGMLLFFFIEKGLRWKHHRQVYITDKSLDNRMQVKPLGKMNLLGDFIHNFTDGTLIAGSFAVSPQLGFITTAAIALHEIPQEISDTGCLVYSGYSLKRAINLNFLSSLSCLVGVVFVFGLQELVNLPVAYLLPVAAGGFIYIAASDMLLELHGEFTPRAHAGQGLMIVSGLLIMMGAAQLETLWPVH
ncbi:MAG: ZIP family metal transporter [Flammeovirgaceae bacterium]